ncbi:MAG: universal stress protein [Candidatus Rokubacteria bacterium]|nr:universal stress protein [Candidatus Rokubacteria bacterium]
MRPFILVPLDGSEGSEAALTEVARLAEAEGAAVRLLHVAEPVVAVMEEDRVVRYADQEAARVTQEARAYLLRSAAALPGIDVDLAVRFGDPVEEIVREAERPGVDLVAMATHRRTGLGRLFEGSVAERVERATRVPVLLVRYGERQPV